jgi:hypothetical protein
MHAALGDLSNATQVVLRPPSRFEANVSHSLPVSRGHPRRDHDQLRGQVATRTQLEKGMSRSPTRYAARFGWPRGTNDHSFTANE